MENLQRKKMKGTASDKLRPYDPGKQYKPPDVTDKRYDDSLLTSDLQGMSTETPDLPAVMSNDDQPSLQTSEHHEKFLTIMQTSTIIDGFIGKVWIIDNEIKNIRRKNMRILDKNSGIINELMDQEKSLLERKTKLMVILSRFRNKFEVMVEDFNYGSLNPSNREEFQSIIEYTFRDLESIDIDNAKLKERVKCRRDVVDIKKIKKVPASRAVVCNETQLYFSVVEMPSEEVELQSEVMEVIPEQLCKVETSLQLIYVSECYETVDEEFVKNLLPEELKYVGVIYINSPEDIMNNNMNADHTEDRMKNLEKVCKSERLPKMYVLFENGLKTPRKLTILAYLYLSPGFKYRDRDNGPSKVLVSGFINKIWNHNVYDRGKLSFYYYQFPIR